MVVADELQNGRVVMQSSINANRCLETNITCNNDLGTGAVTVISNALAVLAVGNSSVDVTVTCNDDETWHTNGGATVAQIFCAIPKPSATEVTTVVDSTTRVIDTAPSNSTTTPGLCAGTEWDQWEAWTSCSATCGACGTRNRTRTCFFETNECKCEGAAEENEVCGTSPCTYPVQLACCSPYVLGAVNGEIRCKVTT
ncbi:unnamed protein product [Enterobius vermicularis]|uniref:ShKT domain-containing protein n=1 Tax=Enterobius vermicularis TaxID=51028 RepID=A0A0N4UT93_ENTVE|nr:unnamed protein product [Enterobius vermicularis]